MKKTKRTAEPQFIGIDCRHHGKYVRLETKAEENLFKCLTRTLDAIEEVLTQHHHNQECDCDLCMEVRGYRFLVEVFHNSLECMMAPILTGQKRRKLAALAGQMVPAFDDGTMAEVIDMEAVVQEREKRERGQRSLVDTKANC